MNLESLVNPILIWFLVGLVMFCLELAGPGLILFFFGAGAWVVALMCAFVKISINVQLFLFIVCSVLSLVLFRNIFKKVFHGHKEDTQDPGDELDDFIGQKAIVKNAIVPSRGGKIEFKGVLWTADADEEIEVDAMVKIIARDNLTLKVEKT